MNKRGQITAFVMVGIIILILVVLVLFLRNNYGVTVPTNKFLQSKFDPIRKNTVECIDKYVKDAVETLGKQGGDLTPGKYVRYKGKQVRYLCQNIPNKPNCLNVLPPLSEMEKNFESYLNTQITNCIDRNLAKSKYGYTIDTKPLSTKVEAEENILKISVDYPIKISKNDVSLEMPKTIRTFTDVPLGKLYETTHDIINEESITGQFDQLTYMINKKGSIIINVDKPYPDEIYLINLKDSKYEFWFAIEGEA